MPDIIPVIASSSVDILTTDLSMVSVPKYIYFFWLGAPLLEKYIGIVQDMAEKACSSGYKVILWTDNNSLLIFDEFKFRYPEIQLSTSNYRDLLTQCLTSNDSYYRHAALQIDDILAAGKEGNAKPNYSAISDIFRMLILDMQGGLYSDTDNYIFYSTGPMGELEVTKALGYKIYRCQYGDTSAINGSLIASLPRSSLTRRALGEIERIYLNGITPPLAHQVFASWEDFIIQMQHTSSEKERTPNIPPYDKEILDLTRTDIAYWLTRWHIFANMGSRLRPALRAELKEKKPKTTEAALVYSLLQARVYYGVEYGPGMLQNIHNNFPESLRNLSIFHDSFITPSTKVADGQDGTWYRDNQGLVSIDFQATIIEPRPVPHLLHKIIIYKEECFMGLKLIEKPGVIFNFNNLFQDEDFNDAFASVSAEGNLDNNYNEITCELSINTDLSEYDPTFQRMICQYSSHPLTPLIAEMYLAFFQLYRHGGLYIKSNYIGFLNDFGESGAKKIFDENFFLDATYGVKVFDFNSNIIACLPKNNLIAQAEKKLLIFIEEKIFNKRDVSDDELKEDLSYIWQTQINQFDRLSETRRKAIFFSEKEINILFGSHAHIIKERRLEKLGPGQHAGTNQTSTSNSITTDIAIGGSPTQLLLAPASSTDTSSRSSTQYGSFWSSSASQNSVDNNHSTHTITSAMPPCLRQVV